MKKFNLLFVVITSLIIQPIFAGSSQSTMEIIDSSQVKENNNKQTEKFSFDKLPQDIENEVINYAWNNIDNQQIFEQQLLEWKNYDCMRSKETSYLDQNTLGFHGQKKPIYFYTLENGNPTIKTVGTVLNNAQPAMLSGLWYADSTIEQTMLILNAPNKNYTVTLIESLLGPSPKVTSASFSVLGDIAITWENNAEKYITLLTLQDIKNNNSIDLSSNAQKLKDINQTLLQGTLSNCTEVKGSLFNLDGTKLGICTMDPLQISVSGQTGLDNHINNADHAVQYIDINPKKPLTIHEKAKRLSLATADAKKFLTDKQKKN
jgi:hypothetical protein